MHGFMNLDWLRSLLVHSDRGTMTEEELDLALWGVLLETSEDGVIGVDADERITAFNAGAEAIFGYGRSEVVGQDLAILIPKNLREAHHQHHQRALTDAGTPILSCRRSLRALHRNGEEFNVDVCVALSRTTGRGWAIVRNTDASLAADERKLKSLQLMADALSVSAAAMSVADLTQPDQPLIYANASFYALTGYGPEEVLGRNCRFLQGPDTDPDAVRRMAEAIRGGLPVSVELVNYRKDGTPFWNAVSLLPIRDCEGRLTHMIGTQTDVTARHEAEEAAAVTRQHDPVTGLPLPAKAFEALADLPDDGGDILVAAIGVEGMADIIAALGYGASEDLLRRIAERLTAAAAPLFVSRLANESFVLGYAGEAASMADRTAVALKAAFRDPVPVAGVPLVLGCCVGLAAMPRQRLDPERLLREASMALHEATLAGPGSVRVYARAMQTAAHERFEIAQLLWRALRQEDLCLHYQPKHAVGSLLPTSVEALCRWPTADGWISPGVFIPVAEKTGLIGPLGDWVLRRSLKEIREINKGRAEPLGLAVNISGAQLFDRALPDRLTSLLAEADVAPGLLELEITETEAIRDLERAIASMHAFKRTGIRLALDDFGVGQSSLGNLQKLPVDTLKLDRSFVGSIAADQAARSIVQAAIAMARALGKRVVAEGVETHEQLAVLGDLGCDEFQGFLLGRPMPALEIRRAWPPALAAAAQVMARFDRQPDGATPPPRTMN